MSLECLCNKEPGFTEQDFINFLVSQGITVKTNTKARGNLGIFNKNRIDISKNADNGRRLAILAHEFAHKIHYDLEKENFLNGGTLEKIFRVADSKNIQEELFLVTNIVDENSKLTRFTLKKSEIMSKIKIQENTIKLEYPEFKRSYTFKPVNSYFKKNKSSARYLLKYDNVRIVHPFTRKEEIYSIKNIDSDFPEIPDFLRAYIKLTSLQREYKRYSRAINKCRKYYQKPTELFARFVEGLFTNADKVNEVAPETYSRFIYLLNQGYYGKLRELFILADIRLETYYSDL